MTEKIQIKPYEGKREDYNQFRWSLDAKAKALLQKINEKMSDDTYRFRFDTSNVYGYEGDFKSIFAEADTSILDDPPSARVMYLELSEFHRGSRTSPRIEADIDLVNRTMTTRCTANTEEISNWYDQILKERDVKPFFELASDFGGYYLARLKRSIDGFAELNKLIK